jgi:hypothetical protein
MGCPKWKRQQQRAAEQQRQLAEAKHEKRMEQADDDQDRLNDPVEQQLRKRIAEGWKPVSQEEYERLKASGVPVTESYMDYDGTVHEM